MYLNEDIDENMNFEPYQKYFKKITFKDTCNKYFEEEGLPYEIENMNYNTITRTLEISATMYLKAYGNSHTAECTYIGERSSVTENVFLFDKGLSEDEAEFLYPIGLVKTGSFYPSQSFEYFKRYDQKQPKKLDYIDYIIIDIVKDYD